MIKLKAKAKKEAERAVLATVLSVASLVISYIDPSTGALTVSVPFLVIAIYKAIEAAIHQYWDD